MINNKMDMFQTSANVGNAFAFKQNIRAVCSCHVGSSPVAVTSPSDFAPVSSKEFLDIQATIECGFTLKRVHDMTRTYSHRELVP